MSAVLGFTCLFVGLVIVNAVYSYQSKHIDPAFGTTFLFQLKMLPLFLPANLLIGYGVRWVQQSFGQLTTALVSAKIVELLVCLLMGYMFMQEMPTWKTWVGLLIIVGGFILMKWK